MSAELSHAPVLLDEVLAALAVREDGWYVDATFGRGGHCAAVLSRLGPNGRVIGIDRDPSAVAAGRLRFAGEARVRVVRGAFGDLIAGVRQALGPGERWQGTFAGVLFDLGVSSPQLDDAARGFSFMQDGPLDMRMDNEQGFTAAAWLASAAEDEIARVIREYGEERFAKRIARAIVGERQKAPIVTTGQLAAVVAAAVPTREPGKHPATRTFQALRIRVNDEFAQIDRGLEQSLELLAAEGRLCAISFHSLEDGLVKRFIQRHSHDDPVYAGLPHIPPHARATLRRVGKAVHPSEAEVRRNPRARSAILRAAARIQQREAA